MFNQTITVLRAPALKDDTGADSVQRDWDNATPTTVSGVNVQPVRGGEVADSAGIWTSGVWVVITPPGSGRLDLLETDRVEYDGMTLEVAAPPEHWPSPTGGWHHTEALLSREPLTQGGTGGRSVDAVRAAAAGAAGRTWSP